jgi:hypothetical protein
LPAIQVTRQLRPLVVNKHGNISDLRMGTITQAEINEPVLSRKWQCWLRSDLTKNIHSGSLPSGKNRGYHVPHFIPPV